MRVLCLGDILTEGTVGFGLLLFLEGLLGNRWSTWASATTQLPTAVADRHIRARHIRTGRSFDHYPRWRYNLDNIDELGPPIAGPMSRVPRVRDLDYAHALQ